VLTRFTGRGSDLLDERLRETVVPAARTAGSTGPPGPPLRDEFPDHCHPAVFGAEMFDLLGRSRTVVHDEVNGAATSLRLFEATGMGAALVTDATDGLAELFEFGTEVLTYRTIDEALDLVRALRDDPALAGRVGAAGRARTHRDHSVTARARQLDALLRNGPLDRRRAVRSPQPTAARSAA
jgi:glycosyltransferase involved in cell wall biosynthesis